MLSAARALRTAGWRSPSAFGDLGSGRVPSEIRLELGRSCSFPSTRSSSAAALSPRNLAYEETAAIPYGGLLALHYLRRAALEPGHAIVIYGASGGVGTSAVQLARHMGAEVTAVCGAANAELVRSLGAAHVMDYTTEPSPPEGARYHAVLDAVGKRKTSPLRSACEDALAPGGRSISVERARGARGRTARARPRRGAFGGSSSGVCVQEVRRRQAFSEAALASRSTFSQTPDRPSIWKRGSVARGRKRIHSNERGDDACICRESRPSSAPSSRACRGGGPRAPRAARVNAQRREGGPRSSRSPAPLPRDGFRTIAPSYQA
ncbi:zinc-binding dehydrogenase [Sorangium sp. So ce321]|uniref:zinc-binding dehydrogenase n=1 Tax=Sorangium sp. So ce321 TaxID=3133300 RepID=UPI003F60DF25